MSDRCNRVTKYLGVLITISTERTSRKRSNSGFRIQSLNKTQSVIGVSSFGRLKYELSYASWQALTWDNRLYKVGGLKEYPLSSTISSYLVVKGRAVRGHEEEHEGRRTPRRLVTLRSGRVDRKVAFVIGDFLEADRGSL